MAAAVLLPPRCCPEGVDDSKKLSEAARERLYPAVIECALAYGVGIVEADEIDRTNILRATLAAMAAALDKATADLAPPPELVLVDGNTPFECPHPLETVVKGDQRSTNIAAASILAKVTRDRIMRDLHDRYPVYSFASNKGYGSRAHLDALASHGPCPVHRKTFRGVV